MASPINPTGLGYTYSTGPLTEVTLGENNMHDIELRVHERHYSTEYDLNAQCPQCSTNHNVEKLGNLQINGIAKDVFNCTDCNRLFFKTSGAIQAIMEEARRKYDTENVTFVSTNGTAGSELAPNEHTIEQVNYNTRQTTQEIQSLNSNMERLIQAVENMQYANTEILNKLLADPLSGMKKVINNFNLE